MPKKIDLTEHVLELIRRISTNLPIDVTSALEQAHKREKPQSAAERALASILENIRIKQIINWRVKKC